MKNGLESMLADQRLTAEKYKANFSLLESQHVQLQSEVQQLKDDLIRQKADKQNNEKRYENQVHALQSERDKLLIEIESLKGKIMTPAKLENLRQNLLRDVEMIYKQHLSQTEDEVDMYRKELNKLKYDHAFLKTEYENCQNEYAQKLEDVHSKYKLDIDTLQRKNNSIKMALEQKGAAAEESVSLVKENTKLTVKLKSLAIENENFRKQIADSANKTDSKVTKLSTQLSELTVKHEITCNENRNLNSRIEKLQSKLEHANAEITKQIPKLAKFEDQKVRYSSEIDEIKQKHRMELTMAENNYKRLIADVSSESNQLEAQLADANAKIGFFSKTIDQLKQSLQNKEKESADRIEEAKRLQWEAAHKSQQEKQQVESRLAAAEKMQVDIKHQADLDIEKLNHEIDSLQANNELLKKEKDNLNIMVYKLKSNHNAHSKDVNHVQRLESDVQSLDAQLQASTIAYKDELAEKEKLKAKNKLANEEITKLRNEVKDLRQEFEKICESNNGAWQKENETLKERYQALKKRIGKGDRRRETILKLARKQKHQHQQDIISLKDTILAFQAKEKSHEMEKDNLRKKYEIEANKYKRRLDQFKMKAAEFETLLYDPVGQVNTTIHPVVAPSSYSDLLAKEQEQKHELVEMMKNLNTFIEKQEELEKIV